MTRRTARRIGVCALAAAGLAIAWALLAPPHLGGSTRYVVLDGTSMEPGLSAGDLALVRGSTGVERGDVVLYEHPRLGAQILHRVVREANGRLVLKGDNNDFLDDARPAAGDVEGELWLAIPHAGSAVVWARKPRHAALLVFALAFVALGGLAALGAARRPAGGGRGASGGARDHGVAALGVALGAAAVFGLLAIVSYSRPPTHSTELADAYAHVGTFSYGADVEETEVYPDGVVDTGETAFLELVRALDVTFRYALEAPEASGVDGTAALSAELSDGTGWTRTLPLGEPVAFVGRSGSASGTLDLDEVTRVVEEVKTLTGTGTSVFAVTIAAAVDLRGSVENQRLTPVFQPKLRFELDPVSLRPASGGEESAGFVTRRSEALTVQESSTLALGGLRLSVHDSRRLALLGLFAALVAAGLVAVASRPGRGGGAPAQVASLLGDRLITLSRAPTTESSRITELADVSSLVQIAEHYDRIVLHWRDGAGHAYQVEDAATAYRLRLTTALECVRSLDDQADTLVLAPGEGSSRAAVG